MDTNILLLLKTEKKSNKWYNFLDYTRPGFDLESNTKDTVNYYSEVRDNVIYYLIIKTKCTVNRRTRLDFSCIFAFN